MTNLRTTIAGALAATGTFLAGAPIAFAVFGSDFIPTAWARIFVVSGFAMQAVGLFFGHLFSADSQTVNQIKQDVKDLRTGSEIFKNENKPPNGNP
jgi:hypothetical protein